MGRQTEGYELLNANIKTNLGAKDLDTTYLGCGSVPSNVAGYITVTEGGDEHFHKTILACNALPISVADVAGTIQHGGVQVYTMPKGIIFSMGATTKGNLTMGVTGTFIDAFTGATSLGTVVAAGDGTLTSTEATWLASTANATAAAKVAAIKGFTAQVAATDTTARTIDGSTTAAPVFFNAVIADDATHTAGTGAFTGTITVAWVNLGAA